MKIVSNESGDPYHSPGDVMTVYRKRDDFIVILNKSNILYTFEVVDYVNHSDNDRGHMIVRCTVGGLVYTTRRDYEWAKFFEVIESCVHYIMVQILSRIIKPH
jgi:hypothetical protein